MSKDISSDDQIEKISKELGSYNVANFNLFLPGVTPLKKYLLIGAGQIGADMAIRMALEGKKVQVIIKNPNESLITKLLKFYDNKEKDLIHKNIEIHVLDFKSKKFENFLLSNCTYNACVYESIINTFLYRSQELLEFFSISRKYTKQTIVIGTALVRECETEKLLSKSSSFLELLPEQNYHQRGGYAINKAYLARTAQQLIKSQNVLIKAVKRIQSVINTASNQIRTYYRLKSSMQKVNRQTLQDILIESLKTLKKVSSKINPDLDLQIEQALQQLSNQGCIDTTMESSLERLLILVDNFKDGNISGISSLIILEPTHVIGPAEPGCISPYFRDFSRLLYDLSSGELKLPFSGDIIQMYISSRDLARLTNAITDKPNLPSGFHFALNPIPFKVYEYFELFREITSFKDFIISKIPWQEAMQNGAENMLYDFYIHPKSIAETLKLLGLKKDNIFKDNLKAALTYSWTYNVDKINSDLQNISEGDDYKDFYPSPIIERMNSPYRATFDPEKRFNSEARKAFGKNKEKESPRVDSGKTYREGGFC